MIRRTHLVFLLALLVLVSIVLWQRQSRDTGRTDSSDPEYVVTPDDTLFPIEPVVHAKEGDLDVTAKEEEDPSRQAVPPEGTAQSSSQTIFSGRVLHKESLAPVERCRIRLTRRVDLAEESRGEIIKEIDDPKGRFSIPLEQGGLYWLHVSSPGFQDLTESKLNIPEEGLRDFVLRMEPGSILSGRVVDDATDVPLEGAGVSASWVTSSQRGKDGSISRRAIESGRTAVTDGMGRFELIDLKYGMYLINVSHPDYAAQTVDAATGDRTVEIRMQSGFFIHGKTYDDHGQPAQSIGIRVAGGSSISGPDGYYRTARLSPGRYLVTAKSKDQGGRSPMEFTEEKRRVKIEDRDVELDFGPSPDHVTWKGTFYGWEGKPVSSGRIRVWKEKSKESSQAEGIAKDTWVRRRVDCDRQGRFEIRKLIPGLFKVDLNAPGEYVSIYNAEREVITFDGPGIYEHDLHLRKTEISGKVIDGVTGKVIGEGFVSISSEERYYSQGLNPDGRFCIRGIQPGTYFLSAQCMDRGSAKYGEVSIEENQVIQDLEIVLPAVGMVKLVITDLKNIEDIHFERELRYPDGTLKWTIAGGRFTEEGTWESHGHHEVGSWILVLKEANLGKVERSFEVKPDTLTEIRISAAEFSHDR
ncbi:MAG: carboxypeptidase-like regulatory domain-containing protein [Planctomycetota bacterium]|jgi:hypothetical protein